MSVYRTLAATIREDIERGRYAAGRLPTQPELASEYRVGLATIHRAIGVLKLDEIVYTTADGTFVGHRPKNTRCF